MKKLLLIMLITSTTMANAGEGRYTMTSNQEEGDISYVWVLDSEKGRFKMCWLSGPDSIKGKLICKKWKDLNDEEKY